MHPRESQTQQTIIPGWFGVQETTGQRGRDATEPEAAARACVKPAPAKGGTWAFPPSPSEHQPPELGVLGDPEHQADGDGDGEHPRDATGIHRVVRDFP